MYCRTGPVNIPATLKLVEFGLFIVMFPPVDTPSRVASESGSSTVWLLLASWAYTCCGGGELINGEFMICGNTFGSTASTPTEVLLPRGPKAFGLTGKKLSPSGVAVETCGRLVRLFVKLMGRDWFAIRIISAPSASCIPWSSAVWTPP